MDYKIIVIDQLWNSLEMNIVKNFIWELFLTKKIGYGTRHKNNYIPVGKEDFIGSHILICKKIDGDLRPVCISKIVTSLEYENFGLINPMLKIMDGFFSSEYVSFINQKISDLKKDNKIISYSGGFTINRNLILNDDELNKIKEIYCALHTLFHQDRKVDTLFGFSCPRLKTDKFFSHWGIHPILMNGRSPSGFPKDLNLEEVKCVSAVVKELSFYSIQMSKKYKYLWSDRIDSKYLDQSTAA